MSRFGQFIREKRRERGLSLRALASAIGCSHVYLGEVERGVRNPFNEEWWPHLIDAMPSLTVEDLRHHTMLTVGVQLKLQDASPQYQDLGLALARRIEKEDLRATDMQALLDFLREPFGHD